MMGTDLYNRSSVLSDLLWCIQEKLRRQVLFVLCLFLPMALILDTRSSGAQEKAGEDTSTIYRVFEKLPEHGEGHLYDNSNWSHDGTKIAFMVHDLDARNTCTIWVYHFATNLLTQITHADTIGMLDTMPVWSPDDTQITFGSDRGGGLHVWVVDADGDNLRKVTEDLERNEWGDVWTPRPDWTPDGQSLVYADEVDDNWDIYQTNLTDGSVLRLTDHPADDGAPRCSPDGKYISFLSERSGENALWLMDTASGEVEKIDTEITGMQWTHNWSPDSQWIVTDIPNTGWGWEIRAAVISVQTGRAFSVPAPTPNEMDHATWTPSWSPDGRSLLYSSTPTWTFDSSLKVLDLKTEEITTLRDSLVQVRQLTWSPDNKQIAYFSIRPATEEEAEQDSVITLVNAKGDGYSHTSFFGKEPDWSPDGSHIACITADHTSGLLALYDVKEEQTTIVATGHEGINYSPRFSPDGELLAYFTRHDEDDDLWVYDTVTKNHFQLTFSGGRKDDITWSPDGESIVFGKNSGGPRDFFDLWTVLAYGGKPRRITANEQHDRRPLWPAGKIGPIYYASQRGDNWELWKTDLAGNEAYVFHSSPVTYPVLINDPSHIYYGSGEGWWPLDIHVTNTDTKTEKRLTEGNARNPQPSPDATKIAYADYEPRRWDQAAFWIADVGNLFPSNAFP